MVYLHLPLPRPTAWRIGSQIYLTAKLRYRRINQLKSVEIHNPRADLGACHHCIRQTHPVRTVVEQPCVAGSGDPTCGSDGAIGIVGQFDLPGRARRLGHRLDEAAQPAAVGHGTVEKPAHLGRGASTDGCSITTRSTWGIVWWLRWAAQPQQGIPRSRAKR